VGIWAAGASLALTAGPLAGGVLIALVGWRSIFFVNLPIGLTALWVTWRYARETPRSPQRELDLPGQAAAIGALGCLAGAIIEGGARGWGHPWVLAGFTGFAALAAFFIFQERSARQPMLPLELFKHPLFSLTSLIGLIVNAAFYGLIFVLSLYFQQMNGLSALATGVDFLPMMAAVFVVNLFAARAAERLGALMMIAAGAGIAALGCLGLLGIERGSSYGHLCAQLVAMGAGLGLLVPPLTAALLGSVKKSRSGVAAGVLNSTRQTGSVLGVAVFGSLLGRGDAFMTGAHICLVISAFLFIGAAGVALRGARITT
jgi:DHA2 family methylenomycin A resistance protein-like MFS transporter